MNDPKLRSITSVRRPDPDMIALLERLLCIAKSGEMTDLVCIWTTPGTYESDWVASSERYGLVGYMSHVQSRIADDPDTD